MCGIFAIFSQKEITAECGVNAIKTLLHRGPDSNKIWTSIDKTIMMAHTRLKINGSDSTQPIILDNVILIINGEIFNWKQLSKELSYNCTISDCEILIPLYNKYIRGNFEDVDAVSLFFKKLNGQYSFVLYDTKYNFVFASRDHIGVTPMYYGYNTNDDAIITKIGFASELKALTGEFNSIKTFNPRRYILCNLNDLSSEIKICKKYLDYYLDVPIVNISYPNAVKQVNKLLVDSVKSQMNDLFEPGAPDFGVLLSGGLDSSVIAAISAKLATTHGIKIKTFSIGLPNAVDIIAARKVAEFIGSDHTEYTFTIEEGINAIPDVIWYTETYDTTSVRASTPMYLLTKKIKNDFPKLKVLFSGELSDELLCYLYGSNAPSLGDFRLETINLVSNVHLFDCLRANKTGMANSIEIRVPFTDRAFVECLISLPTEYKTFGKLSNKHDNSVNKIEKLILREAFIGYLPDSVLYRKKEQFSDGVSAEFKNKEKSDVGGNWIQSITNYSESLYSNEIFILNSLEYNLNRPKTKEQLWYRDIFCKCFNKNSYSNTSEFTIKFWEPKWSNSIDPSARLYSSEHF